MKILQQSLPFLASHISSPIHHLWTHTRIYTIFSAVIQGSMELEIWIAGWIPRDSLPTDCSRKYFFLYLEAQGIYIWGLGCIWKESILQNLSLEIKRVDRHNNFSKSVFMDLICSSALDWQTALFGELGWVWAIALSPGFVVDTDHHVDNESDFHLRPLFRSYPFVKLTRMFTLIQSLGWKKKSALLAKLRW